MKFSVETHHTGREHHNGPWPCSLSYLFDPSKLDLHPGDLAGPSLDGQYPDLPQ